MGTGSPFHPGGRGGHGALREDGGGLRNPQRLRAAEASSPVWVVVACRAHHERGGPGASCRGTACRPAQGAGPRACLVVPSHPSRASRLCGPGPGSPCGQAPSALQACSRTSAPSALRAGPTPARSRSCSRSRRRPLLALPTRLSCLLHRHCASLVGPDLSSEIWLTQLSCQLPALTLGCLPALPSAGLRPCLAPVWPCRVGPGTRSGHPNQMSPSTCPS